MQYGMPYPGQYVANATEEVRIAFIRRVYMLFFGSIATTIATGFMAAQEALIAPMLALRPIFIIGTFACLIGMWFARKASGLNVVLLYLFAAMEGALLGPVVSIINQVMPGVPAQAAWLCSAVCRCMSFRRAKISVFLAECCGQHSSPC
jgi:hypothetical protein